MRQKSTDKLWIDESGTQIPYSRITAAERLMERSSAKLIKEALAASDRLKKLKINIYETCTDVEAAFMKENGIEKRGKGKGNFTWHNFDRSIKVEVNVSEPIVFDDLTIQAAKEKFDLFFEKNVSATTEYIKKMILEAFETSRGGKLDTKEVMNLVRYEKKVNKPLFSEAVALINQAIRRPKTKTYFKIYERQQDGSYKQVELNLASI
ncbi:DUF3164 family protein [Flavobacteriaceae bacterium]|nr:DUF3164 family protein [Flavobacteriaceae bacterium]MDC1285227.1 DUF3164 family protein [Flavobacteriaceae bacterium]